MTSGVQQILIIEDDAETRAALGEALSSDGHRVLTAGSLGEALQSRPWKRISAIIMELALPDGEAVQWFSRASESVRQVPVLILTDRPDSEQTLAALDAGAFDFVLKPVHPAALRARLKRITERRRTEQRLAESEARNRALLDAIPDTMLRISRLGRILDCRTHRHSGIALAADELLNLDVRQSPLTDELVGALLSGMERALSTESVVTIRSDASLPRGRKYIEARLVKSGEDEVVALLRDVTSQKQAEDQTLSAERLLAVGQMMAGLAHESRNAFQRIQACLEMLALEVEDRPEALELVERIQRAQDHLHYIYEEVRSYAAPINLRLQSAELNQIWRDTWAHLEMQRIQKNVRLDEELHGMVPVCQVDEIALEQVFRNVLENAIDASPAGATITIVCRPAWIGERKAVRVSVIDCGPGFSAEARLKVFEPFYTTKARGTGLGMAIARRIVEAHSGEITVGDTGGGGAEVRITLPSE